MNSAVVQFSDRLCELIVYFGQGKSLYSLCEYQINLIFYTCVLYFIISSLRGGGGEGDWTACRKYSTFLACTNDIQNILDRDTGTRGLEHISGDLLSKA